METENIDVGILRPSEPVGTKKEYETALRNILSIGERHTDSAVSRRLSDFRLTIKIAREALWGPDNLTKGGLVDPAPNR